MGWLGITRGLGEVGNDVAGGAEQVREERRQEAQDRAAQMERQLKAIQVRAQLANLYQGMRQANVPQAIGKPVQGSDGKWRQLVRDPNNGKMDVVELKGYGELTPEEQKVQNAERIMGHPLTPEQKEQVLGLSTQPKYTGEKSVRDPNSPTGWSWIQIDERDPTKRILVPGAPDPYKGKTGGAGEGFTQEDVVDAADDLMHRRTTWGEIETKGGFRKAVRDYIHAQGKLPPRKPTGDEERRADLAENVDENLKTIEDIVTRRPELFGKVGGAKTWIRQFATSDPDISALRDARDNLARASTGAHSMRAASALEGAARAVLGHYMDDPRALLSSIKTARKSVGTFLRDVGREENEGAESEDLPSTDPMEDIIQRALKTPKPSAGKK